MTDLILNLWRFVVYFIVDIFYRVLFHSRGIGIENIPKKGGVLLASNHLSGWDVFLIPYWAVNRFSGRHVYSPAKEELFKFPPMAWALHSLRVFPVKRNTKDFRSMERIASYAKEHVVMIYPEGTRSKTGKLGKGKSGVGKIIWESKAAVVPTLVINTHYCTPKGKLLPNFFQKMYVVYGKPMEMAEYYAMENSKETSRLIVNRVMEEIAKLKEEYKHLEDPPKWLKEARAHHLEEGDLAKEEKPQDG